MPNYTSNVDEWHLFPFANYQQCMCLYFEIISMNMKYTVGQKIKKSPAQKNTWNQINQFHEFFFVQIPFFAISKMAKNQFLNWQ